MRGKVLMALMVTYYFIRELWSLGRWRVEYIKPFPFSEIEIARQTYIAMFCGYGGMFLVTVIMHNLASTQRIFWGAVMILAGLEFIEYPLNYNEFWFRANFGIFELPVNVTVLRYFVLLIVGGYELWKK